MEKVDPQYVYAASICASGGVGGAVSVFLAALAAYQLRCPGEEFWRRFSEYYARDRSTADPVEKVSKFVLTDSCSSFLRDIKVGRVRKFSKHLSTVSELISSCSFRQLWHLASRVLDSDLESKTVVFAVKMGYYGGRALGLCENPLPPDIPIPVDSRVGRASLNLGLVSAGSVEEVVSRCRNHVVSAWRYIGEKVGVPPIHLDTLLWALQRTETLSSALARVSTKQAAEAIARFQKAILSGWEERE